METELNAVFRDFEVGDADDAVTKKKSPYPMSNESKFNFSKKKFMPPFYGWGSAASRLEPLRGGSLLFYH